MKLIFSETTPDYSHYLYPYVVWAVPEAGETPDQFFAAGFLPAAPDLSRFYLCRQIRIVLANFSLSSENRRILRKGEGIRCQLVPRHQFDYNAARRSFFKDYADQKFGKDVMTWERLDLLFQSRVVSHLLVFNDEKSGAEIGVVVLFLHAPAIAFYYYGFYDLACADRNLGMFMMTSAVEFFSGQSYRHVHLGTCYSEKALYKTQFNGVEFFNGFRWSQNLDELKFLVRRNNPAAHLLQTGEFTTQFYEDNLENIIDASRFQLPPPS